MRTRAAVLGSPIAHSMSPVLHRAAYRVLGLEWTYEAIEVTASALPEFLHGLDDRWAGLSLTMPLKESVLPILDWSSDTVRLTSAANTVLISDDGLRGHNTDVFGIVAAVRAAGPARIGEAGIIGAGATARSAVVAAAQLGVRRVVVVARRPEATGALVETAAALGVDVAVLPWHGAAQAMACGLVISTVPGDAGASLASAVPSAPRLLLDVTYRPWPTSLAAAWSSVGGPVVPGARMLLWQAVRQVELMTGIPAPVDAMDRALSAAG